MKTVMMITTTILNCRRPLPTNTNWLDLRPRMPTRKSLDRTASLCSGKSNTMKKKPRKKIKKDKLMVKMLIQIA